MINYHLKCCIPLQQSNCRLYAGTTVAFQNTFYDARLTAIKTNKQKNKPH